jgi:hypothetical protein
MSDIFDLLSLAKISPEAFKAILTDTKKVASFNLSSDELATIKKLDPSHIRVIMDAIESRLRGSPVAGTNACPGTFACVDKSSTTSKTTPI